MSELVNYSSPEGRSLSGDMKALVDYLVSVATLVQPLPTSQLPHKEG
ncbi:MAG: hypothetical protein IKZ87_04155 [Actinomycetaceae bacterium]|nr:hypothetical protein [Actinomycetaceae bacterium]